MDDVFSPIVRQFKKINIIPFGSRDETKRCIQRPMEKIGVEDLFDVFDFACFGVFRRVVLTR
jgi:hypothetical protein